MGCFSKQEVLAFLMTLCWSKLSWDLFIYIPGNSCIISAMTKKGHKGAMKILWDVYESLKSPITFSFVFKQPRRITCWGGLRGEGESEEGHRSMENWQLWVGWKESVPSLLGLNELSQQATAYIGWAMLIELHKLPDNYPGGKTEGGKNGPRARLWKEQKVQNRLLYRPPSGPDPDAGLQFVVMLMMVHSRDCQHTFV